MNVQSISNNISTFQLDIYKILNDLKRNEKRYTPSQQLLLDLHELGCTQAEIMISAHLAVDDLQKIANGNDDDDEELFDALLCLWARKDLEQKGLWPVSNSFSKNNVPRVTKRSA